MMKDSVTKSYIPQLSIDCVIFGYQDQQLNVLIPKLHFKGDFWALPSSSVYQSEDIDAAAVRILRERTGLTAVRLKQFKVMGGASRNRRAHLDEIIRLNPEKLDEKRQKLEDYQWFVQRYISICYYALVDISRVVPEKDAITETLAWCDVQALPPMILDHREIIAEALTTVRAGLYQQASVFNLLPATFTMKEAQELYELLLGKKLARNNFQAKILELDVLERLEKKYTGAANKAPYLYRLRPAASSPGT